MSLPPPVSGYADVRRLEEAAAIMLYGYRVYCPRVLVDAAHELRRLRRLLGLPEDGSEP